jgi:hypothetical protein
VPLRKSSAGGGGASASDGGAGIELQPMGTGAAAAAAGGKAAAAKRLEPFSEPLETVYVALWRAAADEVSSSYAGTLAHAGVTAVLPSSLNAPMRNRSSVAVGKHM